MGRMLKKKVKSPKKKTSSKVNLIELLVDAVNKNSFLSPDRNVVTEVLARTQPTIDSMGPSAHSTSSTEYSAFDDYFGKTSEVHMPKPDQVMLFVGAGATTADVKNEMLALGSKVNVGMVVVSSEIDEDIYKNWEFTFPSIDEPKEPAIEWRDRRKNYWDNEKVNRRNQSIVAKMRKR